MTHLSGSELYGCFYLILMFETLTVNVRTLASVNSSLTMSTNWAKGHLCSRFTLNKLVESDMVSRFYLSSVFSDNHHRPPLTC